MSVVVRCDRPYKKEDLRRMIVWCGCCPPEEPYCPPICDPCPQPVCAYTLNCCPPPCPPPSCSPCMPPIPLTCMPCPPQPCLLPCAPRPYVCPPCTGHPCITCAPLPKPVPAPFELGPVYRAPITTGGLFYTGTVRYPCVPYAGCC
ncbi:small proline-rich protein 2B-like [Ceratina calcarata]|uniref:Small proline-rich protein 2B-like n=1 Tax=Ceratina calcarata TaxID=156304 RepID=A0AAJ7RZ36_9HYME|nr:small proline-rich protein 2B-like [Ceratina calcarata]